MWDKDSDRNECVGSRTLFRPSRSSEHILESRKEQTMPFTLGTAPEAALDSELRRVLQYPLCREILPLGDQLSLKPSLFLSVANVASWPPTKCGASSSQNIQDPVLLYGLRLPIPHL